MGCCPVIELRQYTLRPHARETLIELFDREFVESQEATGMHVIGQFRDLNRPDRFVWLRGFSDMAQRRVALENFYDGPVWKAHANAANVTMLDFDDVLLLRPVTPHTGFDDLPPRPPPTSRGTGSRFAITVCALARPADPSVVVNTVLPAIAAAPPLAAFVEEPSENDYPSLPVRSGEHVLVWISRAMPKQPIDAAGLIPGLVGAPLVLHVEATARSRLR